VPKTSSNSARKNFKSHDNTVSTTQTAKHGQIPQFRLKRCLKEALDLLFKILLIKDDGKNKNS